ncbi:phage tail tape measure protein [Cedecea sp. NFIX57]|uniref:phage tail tape measure protein n=1 Tax=Cedecea sp. NFIX57 TaxID=1566286 RepID=UPI000A0A6B35|nr:phage tail tape measure protein [Cedecea sp. NFIX57]SMG62012.1 Phage-related minor tail protein [Cedecea sp. NFIX57]
MAGPFETQFSIGLKDNFTERYRQIQAEVKRAQQAREQLGMRSGMAIRSEIRQQISAYQDLARSGVVSAEEQGRAYTKLTENVGKLRKELGETDRAQHRLMTGLKSGINLIGSVAAGATGAAMVLSKPLHQQRDFDSELHTAANFLYRDKNSVQERLAGVTTLRENIYKATEYGGGKREDAVAAAEVLGRSKMPRDQIYSTLPEIMKVNTATGADPRDVASLATATYNFGLEGKQSLVALDAATTAAQHGKADLSILARETPRGLENARGAGFVGTRGYADVMALYETAAAIAGNADEGATNASDLLTELSSRNLAHSAHRVKIHGRAIDWDSAVTHDAKEGHNALYTLEHIVQAVDDNDKNMQTWKKQLAKTTDPEKRTNLQRAIDERHRQDVGLFLRNQQSANAFLGYERNKEQFETISDDIKKQFDLPDGKRSTDTDYGVMKDTANYKAQQMETEKERASDAVVKPFSDALGNAEIKLAELAVAFPKVAMAAEGAAMAMSVLALTSALKGGYGLITRLGGGAAGEAITGAGVTAAETAAAGSAGAEAGAAAAESRSTLARLWGATMRGGRGIIEGGKRVLTNGVFEDGLLSIPGVDVLTGVLYPSDTVSGKDENSELARLKSRNQKANASHLPTSSEALSMLQNWSGSSAGGHAGSAFPVPVIPAPVVNVQVLLDGHELHGVMSLQQERTSRRYGS